MAEQCVAVERDLGVERPDLAIGGHDQRVDLDQRRLLAGEDLIQLGEHRPDRPDDVIVDARLERQPATMEVLEAEQRVDVQMGDRVRVLLGDLLDVHPPLGREHHQRRLRRAVEHDRRVVLGRDLRRALDPQLVDGEPTDVHPEDRAGVLRGLGTIVGDLDPAELAAPADLNLCLDRARISDRLGGGDGVVDGPRRLPGRDRNTVAREQLLALVLEQIHRRRTLLNDVANGRHQASHPSALRS